jgi:uncharacterized membrane protein YuzA (DUF378 family)
VLCFNHVTHYLGKGSKWTDIKYNINYMNVFE